MAYSMHIYPSQRNFSSHTHFSVAYRILHLTHISPFHIEFSIVTHNNPSSTRLCVSHIILRPTRNSASHAQFSISLTVLRTHNHQPHTEFHIANTTFHITTILHLHTQFSSSHMIIPLPINSQSHTHSFASHTQFSF